MRVKIGYSNTIELDEAAPTVPVQSDKLFIGELGHKTLIHSLLLKFCITASGEDAPTEASLGDVKLKSTREGDLFTLPLRFWNLVCPFLGLPAWTATAGNTYEVDIPIPFALCKGVRPKDSYLVSEKCNDFFLEISGAQEGVLVYTAYEVRPVIIAEGNNNVAIPSLAPLKFTQDEIQVGSWYQTKLNIVGASFIALCKSDYSDFATTDQLRLKIDGKTMQIYNNILDANRCYALAQQLQMNGRTALDDIPDNVVLLPLSLDRKMSKISRNSIFDIEIFSAAQADWNLYALSQKIQPMNSDESYNVAKRQAPGLAEADVSLRARPVDQTGKSNPFQKALYRKLYVMDNSGGVNRVSNDA